MNKNIIKFFLLTSLILLLSVSLVSASDIANDTSSDIPVSVDNSVKSVDKEVKINNDKLSELSTDYYVSDSSGSDTNSGTSSSPFKTIQAALNKTTSTGAYNIYIGAGTYKGLGNTNLTINGNHTINLIGDGINKTILDGEVSYTIKGGDVWGSDEYWNAYTIAGGNWGLNITSGNGLITMNGFNIQNMVSPGGTSINAYETATVDNYANLVVNNVYFKNNLAGVGGGIRNNNETTLIVNNSIFEGNRKSSSTGNLGSAIYNNGTAIIENSQFIKNIARWGTILNDHILNITNCTIRDGISYDLASNFKMGSGIAIDSGSADYYNIYTLEGIVTNIQNCTFINNGQIDIYQSRTGNLVVNNSIFNQSTGIYINQNNTYNTSIENSKFDNMIPSSLFGDLSGDNSVSFAIYNQRNSNVTIINNTMSVKDNKAYAIRSYYNSTIIINNTLYNPIYINSENIIVNNTINTTSDYGMTVDGSQNIITDNIIESLLFYGSDAINGSGIERSTIENNTPTGIKSLVITENTYNKYFDLNGNIINNITDGSILYISGELTNKKFNINNDLNLTFIGYPESLLTNSQINLNGTGKIILRNINMNTTSNTLEYQILVNSSNNTIESSNFYVNTTGKIHNIIINKDQNTLTNNNITVYGPSNTITYDTSYYGVADTIAILISSSNNTINNNNINMNYTSTQDYGTIEAISIQSKENIIGENKLQNNKINITADQYAYGINLLNTHKNTITGYTIYLNSNNYACGVQLAGNITQNKVTGQITLSNAPIFYGVLIDGYTEANNNDISSTTINKINSTNFTAFNINTANNTNLASITIQDIISKNVIGINIKNTNNNSMITLTIGNINCEEGTGTGIEANNMTNSLIRGSISITNGTNFTGILLNNSENVELNGTRLSISNGTGIKIIRSENITITPRFRNVARTSIQTASTIITVGIGIYVEDSNNINISTNNTITSTLDTIIFNNTNNSVVKENYLLKNNIVGGDVTVQTINSNNITIENNIPEVVNITDSNYDNYFTDGVFNINKANTSVHIGSDLHNKNLTFNTNVLIYGHNYTIYNGTMTLTGNTRVYELNFNSTDDRETILNLTTSDYLYNSTIYQNTTGLIRTIVGSAYFIYYSNITVYGSEIETNDSSASIIVFTAPRLRYSNVNVYSTNYDTKGKISIVQRTGVSQIEYSNLTIDGYNVVALDVGVSDSNLTVNAKNYAIGTNISTLQQVLRNNIIIKSDNEAYGVIIQDYSTPANFGSIEVNYNNFTVISKNNGSSVLFNNITRNAYNLRINYNNFNSENVNTILFDNNKATAGRTTILSNNITSNNILNKLNVPIIINNSNKLEDFSLNIIKTDSNGSVILVENSSDMLFLNNSLLSSNLGGNGAVTMINSSNITVSLNTPSSTVLTNDNYDELFTDGIYTYYDDILELGSDLYNKSLTFTRLVRFSNPNNYTIYNGTITLENIPTSNRNNELKNIKLDYTGNNMSLITVNNVTTPLTGAVRLINMSVISNGNNLNIINITNIPSTLTTTLLDGFSINHTGNDSNIVSIDSGRLTLRNNNITATGNNITTIKLDASYENTINNNTITLNGEKLTVLNTNNTFTFTNNQVYVNPTSPETIFNLSRNVTGASFRNNTIIVNATYSTTPLIYSNKTAITNNYMQTLDNGGDNLVYTDNDANIANNTPTSTGYLANMNITLPSTILNGTNNVINVTVTDIYDNLATEGSIRLVSENQTSIVLIDNGIAHVIFNPLDIGEQNITVSLTSDKYTTDNITLTINVEKLNTTLNVTPLTGYVNENLTLNVSVIDSNGNNVTSGNVYFINDKSDVTSVSINNGLAILTGLNTTYNGNMIIRYAGTSGYYASNTTTTVNIKKHNTTITVDNVRGVVGENITLIARITDENGNNVTSGRVQFKINGVTLRDINGNVIYVNVTRGVARLTLTAVRGWTNTNAYISANYAGNSVYLTSASKNSTVNIAKRNATIEIINDTRVYKAGDTITITAIVTDSNGQLAMSGQVVFKLNGVTLKDRNGKTIMVNVVNGIATLTYTLPSTFADYNYTITAIFAGGDYNRQVSKNSTLQVVKTSIHMDLDPVITTTNTAVVRAKIYDGNNKQITGTTRVTIKLNGVTIINSQNITNGNLQFTINTPYPTGLYNMTIIAGPSSVYEQLQRNTTLVIMKN